MAKLKRRAKHLPTEYGGKKSPRAKQSQSRTWRNKPKCTSGNLTTKHGKVARSRVAKGTSTCDLYRPSVDDTLPPRTKPVNMDMRVFLRTINDLRT